MTIQFLLIALLLPINHSFPPISSFQGFGSQMNLKILSEVVAADEASLRAAIKSNTAVKVLNKTITLGSQVLVKQITNLIIEGPCTFIGNGISIHNSTNVILYNVRVINASIYGVAIYQSHNVVVDHLTILDASRGSVDKGKCIDLTEDSSNVTVSNCILGYTRFSAVDKYKGMLIANFLDGPVTNVSVHHNLFYQNYQRSPEISTNGLFDFRNNLIFGFTVYGTRVREGAVGNFINNYYIGGKKDAMVFVDGELRQIHATGNRWKYDYTEWQNITEQNHPEYLVPAVNTTDYQQVLKAMKNWGCLAIDLLESSIKQRVLDYSAQGHKTRLYE